MSHALLAIQNTLQNSNIFIKSRETVLFMNFGKKKVTQFSSLPPISVSYLKGQSKNRVFFSKLSNFHFDLRPRANPRARQRSENPTPGATKMCESPGLDGID